jgi:hypothetical protein
VNIPIACTLSDAAARVQVADWQLLVHDAVQRCVRVSPTRTELVLYPFFDDLSALATMMQLETRCCAFFRFAFEVTANEFVLSVEVPVEASAVLASFIDEITAGMQ